MLLCASRVEPMAAAVAAAVAGNRRLLLFRPARVSGCAVSQTSSFPLDRSLPKPCKASVGSVVRQLFPINTALWKESLACPTESPAQTFQ